MRLKTQIGLLTFAVVTLIFSSCRNAELPTMSYATWQEVLKDGAIARGWIPQFLPTSSTNIWERHDIDTNAGVVCFFASSSELELLTTQLNYQPTARLDEVGSWVAGWWPANLPKGNLGDLVNRDGFKLYQKPEGQSQTGTNGDWYFVINQAKGVGLGWHRR